MPRIISGKFEFLFQKYCQILTRNTRFEAYDEPWKIMYDTPGQEWEDKWGLFDVNRGLKSGLKIPSCNGATVAS
jgi:hypothetical protein